MKYTEVKYKALDYSGQWVFGSFIHSKRMTGMGCEFRIHNIETSLESDIYSETLCRWTGLYDVNKVEIYDNDIVEDEAGTTGVVKWYNDGESACFVVKWNDGDICIMFNDAAHPNLKVTGNIKNKKGEK